MTIRMRVQNFKQEIQLKKLLTKGKRLSPHLNPPPLDLPFQKKKVDTQFVKFMDMLKKIQINIPFTDALEQMPNYAKFMKDVLSKRRRFKEFEVVNLTKECSVVLQRKLPQKLFDLRSLTISCTIGNSFFKKVLCDLGASIN